MASAPLRLDYEYAKERYRFIFRDPSTLRQSLRTSAEDILQTLRRIADPEKPPSSIRCLARKAEIRWHCIQLDSAKWTLFTREISRIYPYCSKIQTADAVGLTIVKNIEHWLSESLFLGSLLGDSQLHRSTTVSNPQRRSASPPVLPTR